MLSISRRLTLRRQESVLMENERSWSAVLLHAKEKKSELLYKEAMKLAEKVFGDNSSELGLCLMEYADWLEDAGRLEESATVTERYREILLYLVDSVGLLDVHDSDN